MPNFMNARPWRGWMGEDDMTENDWMVRGHQQAMAMMNCLDPFISTPDEYGCSTGGEYNGDYPQSYHDELNARLDNDEYFEAEVEQDLRRLLGADAERNG